MSFDMAGFFSLFVMFLLDVFDVIGVCTQCFFI